MSGICGIVNIDGAPAEGVLLDTMMARTTYRGQDGSGKWVSGAVAIGHQLLVTTPESMGEVQPRHDPSAELLIVFDGRLDNRSELKGALPGLRSTNGVITDAEFILQAYRRWDTKCAQKLLGDFAFALWDGKKKRLFAAGDHFGIKPFYYFFNGKSFVFGSEQSQVLQVPYVPRRVNEGMVGEFLLRKITSKTDTLYQDIYRLPGAHTLCLDCKGLRVTPYWAVNMPEPLRYGRWEDYVENFLEPFQRAVSDRLRCVNRPGLFLSGGLDSSAVAGMAQTILNQRGAGTRLDAYSITLDPVLCVDERPCIESVVEQWQLGSNHSHFEGVASLDWAGQVKASLVLPDFPTVSMNYPLRQQAVASGVRVLLSGMGADSCFGGGFYPYQDILSAGSYSTLIDELKYQYSGYGGKFALTTLLRSLLWPLMPRPFRARLEASRTVVPKQSILCSDFVRRCGLDARLHRYDSTGEYSNMGQWSFWRRFNYGGPSWGFEEEDRADAVHGLDGRHPFYDLRLFEFASMLPENIKQTGADTKKLIRHSGLLPQKVRRTPANAEFGISVYSAVRDAGVGPMLSNLSMVQKGWVNQRRVDAMLQSTGKPYSELSNRECVYAARLWDVFAMELWLKNTQLQH